MFKIVQHDTLGNVINVEYRESILDQPENVLVLYNIDYHKDENQNNIWDGYEIASYYQSKRNIPSTNIIGIKTPTVPTISRSQYDSNFDPDGTVLGIRQQVENILNTDTDESGNILRGKIKYIVLTKGIPHRIDPLYSSQHFLADYASVDASLAMIFNGNYDITWRIENPYYWQDKNFEGNSPFIPEFYKNHLDLRLSFLVTRLDGYTIQDVLAMIDRDVKANSMSRSNTFVLDDAEKDYDDMEGAYYKLLELGASVYPDPWIDSIDPVLSISDSVIGIVSHGIHAGMSPDYILNQYDFNFSDGAIFSSYESYNGVSFSPNINMQQGQVSDFIHIGGSGGVGNAYEPWSSDIADEWILFPAYFAGYTFAEAAYMSLISMDFTAVVVGDPLMRIGPEILPGDIPKFSVYNYEPKLYAKDQSQTTVAQIVFSEEIDTLKLPEFYYYPDDQVLESYVDKNYLYLWSKNPLPLNSQIIYKANNKIYSTQGDSLEIENYSIFWTRSEETQIPGPIVYRATPAGIDNDPEADIVLFFSQEMKTETIFPILGNNSIEQKHSWLGNRILRITHPPFLPGTFYSFYIDEHAKSAGNMGLERNFYFNFETASKYIAYDIDEDGEDEYAFNANNILLDGYEQYLDSLGYLTYLYDHTDINMDNQSEFFISRNGDNYPSYFWDPAALPYTGYIDECFPVDDDEDGILEYAFDDNGSGYFTKVYDPNGIERIRDIKFVLYNFLPAHLSQNVNISTALLLSFTIPVQFDQIENFLNISPKIPFKSIQTELNGQTIKIHLAEPLEELTEYHFSIETGVSSINDDTLSHRYEYSFKTGEQQPTDAPRVISFYPGDSLIIADNTPTVRFLFSLPMDTTGMMPVITDTSAGTSWTSFWADSRTLYLIPLNQLRDNENYKFILSSGLRSKKGILLGGKKSFNFTSGEKSKDFNNPFILQAIPISGSAIRESQEIRIIFSEWIKSDPEQWLRVQTGTYEEPYKWHRIGGNLYSFSGIDVWQPQRKLKLSVGSTFAIDMNSNNLIQDYTFQYNVIGIKISRDVDGDGIQEFVIDGNGILSDGLELYQDPGGIVTKSLFEGDVDNDSFYDFLIADSTGKILLTWYPSRADSGIIGFTEQLDDSIFEMSTDLDDLVEKRVLLKTATIQNAIPRIRNHKPQNMADMVPPYSSLVLDFNVKMNPFSVIQNMSISPLIFGNWSLNESQSKFTFIPVSNWIPSTIYTVKVSDDFQGINGQFGSDSTQFSFRIADGLNQQAGISWQFPQNGDSVHSESIYYVGFNEKADTTITPKFLLVQEFKTFIPEIYWISDTILSIKSPIKLQEGEAVLTGMGQVRFLSAKSIEINNSTRFFVEDELDLKLIKSISGNQQELALENNISYIFNQPLDSLSFDSIVLQENVDSSLILISYTYNIYRNYLSITPSNLKYNTSYVLKIGANLRGITQNLLNYDYLYYFKTESWMNIFEKTLSWYQEKNFLIVTWSLTHHNQTNYELYISEDLQDGPDTIKSKEPLNISYHPSWLLDLRTLAKKFYICARLVTGGKSYWSKPSLVYNLEVNVNDLISIPILNEIATDSIHLYQNNLLSIAQWNAEKSGWNSAKFIAESDTWLSSYLLESNRGSIAKVKINGQIVWMQSMPDSIQIAEPSYPSPRFRSVCNPFFDVTAGSLADYLGQATRLAIWDDDNQGWNEAVYDTVSSTWINNFHIDFLTPVYFLTAEKFSINRNIFTDDNLDSLNLRKNFDMDDHFFPSHTQLIYLSDSVVKMKVLKNNELHDFIVGCGFDQNSHIGFINIGNLDRSANWEFQFFNIDDKKLDVFEVLAENEKSGQVKESFLVGAPYPNPFNSAVTIPIKIAESGRLKITIYNILGQCVHKGEYNIEHAQEFEFHWNGNIASGIYFAQIQFGKYLINRKLMLIK